MNRATAAIMLMALAALPLSGYAAASQGVVFSACKDKVEQAFGKDARVKIHRFRSAGVLLKVRTKQGGQTIKCEYRDGEVKLFAKGKLIDQ